MSEIQEVVAREILDSRGFPTVEVDVVLTNAVLGRAAVPSGASTGAFEAYELRDADNTRFTGKGVRQAVDNVMDHIAPLLEGLDVTLQAQIDAAMLELDGTDQKTKLGANAILGVSLAAAKAAAIDCDLPTFQYLGGTRARKLPVPLMNVLNGGAHANNGLDVQEFMLVPTVGDTFAEALRAGCEVFLNLKKIISQKGLSTAVGDEGGFAPVLQNNRHALELLSEAVEKSGYKLGEDIGFALDVASTELFENGQYHWEGQSITAEALTEVYKKWSQEFPLWSIEDGCAEEDWLGWQHLTQALGERVQMVGDDLFVTNPKRLQQGFEKGVANALLVKVNQIGTLTETQQAVEMAQFNRYNTVMSHRSGETEDTFIADLAVALSCSQIKTGAPSRSERTAKYNQLLRIEEYLGDSAEFWGRRAFRAL